DALATVTGGPIDLAPGVSNNSAFTASYKVTQDDVDAGKFSNTATVTGNYTDGDGDPQTATDVSGTDATNDTPTVTDIAQNPSITLVKAVTSTEPAGGYKLDDIITYGVAVRDTRSFPPRRSSDLDALATVTGGPIDL